MPLKDKILQFHQDLKEYDVSLMAITVNNLGNLERELVDGKLTWLGMTNIGQKYFTNGKIDILLHDWAFKVQYVHDPNMCKEYFWGWRPAFRTISVFFPNSVGVEVGAFEGFLTDQVLKYNKPSKHYLVDPYKVYDDAIGQLGEFNQAQWDGIYESVCRKYKDKHNVEIIRKTSVEAAKDFKDESIDYVYIDADHSYQSVYNDICAWYPKVKQGGIISGHDYRDIFDVKSAVWKFLTEKVNILEQEMDFYSETNDWWFKKC